MSASQTTPTVRDNSAQNRYEIFEGEQLAGFTTYKIGDDRISFLHTEIFPEFAGRGLARRLVTEELEDAGHRELAVLPFCPFVQRVIARNPAYHHLVLNQDRDRFGLPETVAGEEP